MGMVVKMGRMVKVGRVVRMGLKLVVVVVVAFGVCHIGTDASMHCLVVLGFCTSLHVELGEREDEQNYSYDYNYKAKVKQINKHFLSIHKTKPNKINTFSYQRLLGQSNNRHYIVCCPTRVLQIRTHNK